jgi:hypothetical protein
MEQERIIEVVASAPKPGREAEYNCWYEEHIKTGFEFLGLKKVTRRRCFQTIGVNGPASPLYLTIYEFEKKEDLPAFYRSFGNKSASHAAGESAAVQPSNDAQVSRLNGSEISDIVEIQWAAAYETLTALQRE